MDRAPRARTRARWVAPAWACVAVVALATGTAYATGFLSSSATAADTAHGDAAPLFGQPANPDPPLYTGDVTTVAPTIAFDGLWGQLPHDTNVFTVTVPSVDAESGSAYPGGTTFALDVYVTNQPDLSAGAGGHTPWTSLTVEWTLAPCPGGAFADEAAPTPTFSTPTSQLQMPVIPGTIVAELTGMAPGATYCAGIQQANPDANDPATTYIDRPYATDADANAANPAWTSAIPVTPNFTAQIRRTS